MSSTSDWLSSFRQDEKNLLNDFSSTKAKKISITAGKGGVGKTSLTVKIARELAEKGNRVLVIDCDYNLSNTAIKLGLPIDNTFYNLLTAEKEFDECLYKEGNFHLLSACNGSIDLFEAKLKLEEIIIDIINAHEDKYDYVLLDCPAGLNRESLVLNAYSDHRFVIITPDRSSITDSYSLIKLLATKYNVKENHLIVNMINNQNQFSRIVKTISETAENFLNCRTKVLGGVRKAPAGVEDFDQFLFKTGKSDLHEDITKLIDKITDSSNKPSVLWRDQRSQNEPKGQEVQFF